MEESRPGKLALGVKFSVESEIDIESIQFLHLDLKKQKTEPTENNCFMNFASFRDKFGGLYWDVLKQPHRNIQKPSS